MRVSDEELKEILYKNNHAARVADLIVDLKDARAEIARLKKTNPRIRKDEQMRISDEELNAKLDAALKKSLKAIDIGRIVQAESLFHDLREARSEIARLKKQIHALERTSK